MACNTILNRKIILASLLAIGVAGSAQAQGVGNVVGGGGASINGGGEDITLTYSGGGAGGGARYEQLGRGVTFAGNSGDSPSWTYGPAAASDPGLEAWMIGGGDDRQVAYVSPYQRR
jgi:hypothetical protein